MPGAARALGVAVKSVAKWRRQLAAGRLAGLEDAAPVGRRKAQLVLGEAERARLVRWSRRATTAQYLALRAKIVLRCAGGGTNRQAADLGVDESAVGRWRARFIARRLDGLADEPRPGRAPPVLPVMPGTPGRRPHGHLRPGITSVVAAVTIAGGTVISQLHRRRRAIEFRQFLAAIDKAVPAGLDVHPICRQLRHPPHRRDHDLAG